MDADEIAKKTIIDYIDSFEARYKKELTLVKKLLSDPDILKIIKAKGYMDEPSSETDKKAPKNSMAKKAEAKKK